MYGIKELVELGRRVAEDGSHRHERALLEVAFLVQDQSPGAAAVLADHTAPTVLRERALSVASDVLLRTAMDPVGTAIGQHDQRYRHAPQRDDSAVDAAVTEGVLEAGTELQQVLLDWQGQLVGWGA